MKSLRNTLLLLLTVLALAGCSWGGPHGTPEEKTSFRAAAEYLDCDGAEFVFFSGEQLNRTFDRMLTSAGEEIWDSGWGHKEKLARKKQLVIIRMFWQLFAIDQLQSAGFSSKTLAKNPYGENYLHSKFYLGFRMGAKSLLNSFFLDNCISPVEVFGDLPQTTTFAITVAIDPDAVIQALKNSGAWGEEMALEIAEIMPPELLPHLKGKWQLTALDKDFQLLRIKLPTRENELIEMIKKIFPGAKIDTCADGAVVYNSPAAKNAFEKECLKMRDRGDFEMLTDCMPSSSFGFMFESKALAVRKNALESFSVAAKVDNGILFLSNNDNSMFETLLSSYSLLNTLLDFSCGDDDSAAEVQPAPAAATPEPAKDFSALTLLLPCRRNWSAKPGFEGLQATFQGKLPQQLAQNSAQAPTADNCIIVYFGKSAVPTHPLAILRPGKNDSQFQVLNNDGSIKTYQLAKANSCRRIISFLQTVHRWEEADFMRLIALADKFDQKKLK